MKSEAQVDLEPEDQRAAEHDTTSRPLSHRMAGAGVLVIGSRLFSRLFDLLSLLVLSRLLTPADFGLTAIATTCVSIVEVVFELPIAQAMVSAPRSTREMMDTAFSLSLIRGSALAVTMVLVAVALAQIYHNARLLPLITFLAAGPFFRGLISPGLIEYARKMDFRRDVAMEISGKALSCLLAATLAILTHSYWAIAVASVATPLTMCFLSYVFAPYRPGINLSEWEMFRGYISWSSLTQLVSAVNWQFDRLFLGYIAPSTSLGFYSMSAYICTIPGQALLGPLVRPMFVAFSIKRHDKDGLQSAYTKMSAAALMMTGPIYISISAFAKPTVGLLLGKSWVAAAPSLQILALSSTLILPVCPMVSLAWGLGQARMAATRTIGEFLIVLPAIIIGGLAWGPFGVVLGKALGGVAILVVGVLSVRRLAGISVAVQMRAIWRPALALCAMYFFENALSSLVARPSEIETFACLALCVAAGGLIYLLATVGLWLLSGGPEGVEAIVIRRARQEWERFGRADAKGSPLRRDGRRGGDPTAA